MEWVSETFLHLLFLLSDPLWLLNNPPHLTGLSFLLPSFLHTLFLLFYFICLNRHHFLSPFVTLSEFSLFSLPLFLPTTVTLCQFIFLCCFVALSSGALGQTNYAPSPPMLYGVLRLTQPACQGRFIPPPFGALDRGSYASVICLWEVRHPAAQAWLGQPGWMAGDRVWQRSIKHLKLPPWITPSIAMAPAVSSLGTTEGNWGAKEGRRENC